MRKITRIIGVLAVLLLIIGGILFLIEQFRKKGAGISIDTTPTSTVFIDGEQVGRTPYQAIHKPGEVVVKLLPDSFEKPLAPFETKIKLIGDVQTVVKREFGETEDLSSGVIVSFEPTARTEMAISIISVPDRAEVSLDGQVRGSTPFRTSSAVSDHQLTLKAPGFKDYGFNIRLQAGYKLTAILKLAPSGEVEAEVADDSPEPKIQMVEILPTGTGFLRVRSGPSTLEAEVGRVEPGKKYPLIEKDQTSGWFKVEYQEAKDGLSVKAGWITKEFVRVVEATSSALPQP